MDQTTLHASLQDKNVDQLRELVAGLAYDLNYGCYTRPGLELLVWPHIRQRARWIIFADLDGIHALNEMVGYEEVNRRVRAAMQLRKDDFISAGRWYSGDELLWIICDSDERKPSDPQKAAKRLQNAFLENGLSATFGICRVLSYADLPANVSPAIDLVKQAKKLKKRGTVNQTGRLLWSDVFLSRR